MNYQDILDQQRRYFHSNVTRDLNWRTTQLQQIKAMVINHEAEILHALEKDLGKPEQESWITEVSYVTGDVDHTIKHLKKWAKPRKVKTPVVAQPGSSYIVPEPVGSVLIMGAWNYPLQLVLAPLVAVIAAGNCAIIKPSEMAENTSRLLATIIPLYLDKQAVTVVEGGIEESTQLLDLNFDHIMYTGNGNVGRIVMCAAAKHLTPVTLELGGKSPVYIDQSANMKITAQRLAWGKWMNAGQTCIAPDYILTHKYMVKPLVDALTKELKAMYGDNPQLSKSYGRIINPRHTERLTSYLDSGEIVLGGNYSIEDCYIEPTVVVNPELDSKLMTEEIFGPILPIVCVEDFASAKQFVLERDKPLSAYIFTKDNEQKQQWQQEISAGSQCINDVVMFNAVPDLPFGGTGPSGIGQYSGKSGFENFSHLKSVLKRPFMADLPVRFAPYKDWKLNFLKKIR
ncbi:aldehyde dehydrogenase family protein [Thalassotalea mangrovi]|uniref:Aldehyde dehydrogenase n=1 Tax=Thalassotalea mangrovi TaxID=2572245 RepID=A0A4U1B4G7_9GAMM|nr:aldehyde dehydrogenase family protein [Thalassotalea mangrovi]TKB45099.1 aldehyde dehydrogenase family protein [Thalassotalea mangrovi]